MSVQPIGDRQEIIVVLPFHNIGQHVPAWEMPPGVRCVEQPTRGWQLVTISLKTGTWTTMGWVYPTEAEAKVAAKRERRQLRLFWEKRRLHRDAARKKREGRG